MKVILLQDDKNLGKKGAVVEVSDGYARNFLLPKRLAAAANQSNIKEAQQKESTATFRAQAREDEARILSAQIAKVELTIPVKAGENGRLFGSVTVKDVAEALKKTTGLDLDRRKIELKEQVKAVGDYMVLARLHPEITAEFVLHVREG